MDTQEMLDIIKFCKQKREYYVEKRESMLKRGVTNLQQIDHILDFLNNMIDEFQKAYDEISEYHSTELKFLIYFNNIY